MFKLIENSTGNYAEIPQSSSTTFAFVNQNEDTFTEQFKPVKCRDFLGDVVFSTNTQQKASIYGFSYDPSVSKLDTDGTKLSVHFKDKKELERFLETYKADLWYIEDKNKLKRTEVWYVEGNDYLVLVADKFWQSKVWTISLYTHLVRCAGSPIRDLFALSDVFSRESEYMRKIGKQNWDKLSMNLKKIAKATKDVSGWKDTTFSYRIHNASGISMLFAEKRCCTSNKFGDKFYAM